MRSKRHSHVEGLLNIDKPLGLTSHDVVEHIRRQTRVARVGHAGTLDPQATGVLLIGLGTGTKLTQFLHECSKTYRATLKLGVRTDSYDAEGKVIEVRNVDTIGPEQIMTVLEAFQGTIEQVPPMFSALKMQGQRLYTLARQGVEVERSPRQVQIFQLRLLERAADTLILEVECSTGTYIRVLANDIGERLGCGAHLSALVRTAIGPFRREDALALSDLDEAVRQGQWPQHVISLASAVDAFPAIVVRPAAAEALTHGVSPTKQGIAQMVGRLAAGETVAILGEDGGLLAMGVSTIDAAALDAVPSETPAVRLKRVFSGDGRR
jgi:tRNA pseudouridine55 synthase